MPKSKLKTPEWILKGKKASPKKKISEKKFNIKICPKCSSDKVGVVIGEIGFWECFKCKWKGKDIKEKEINEEEFLKFLDEKGEEK